LDNSDPFGLATEGIASGVGKVIEVVSGIIRTIIGGPKKDPDLTTPDCSQPDCFPAVSKDSGNPCESDPPCFSVDNICPSETPPCPSVDNICPDDDKKKKKTDKPQ
jgi:hypothetical protein